MGQSNEDNVLTQTPSGEAIPRSAADARALQTAFGTPTVSTEARDRALRAEDIRKSHDNADEAFGTFVEGVVDAASLGELRETGVSADERRAEHGTANFAGEALGTVIALASGEGPAAITAEVGEVAGQIAARTFLKREAGSIAERVLGEAGAGAALTGATAFNHQLMDSVLEDRDFSASAVMDEAKMGAIIGGIGGGIQGVFGKIASRGEVAAQGGLLGDELLTTKHFDDAFRAYDDALDYHAQQVGAMREFQRDGRLGPVSDGFMDVRSAALKEAQRAQAAYREIDLDKALDGSDPEAYGQWQKRAQRYREAVRDLDEIMVPDKSERLAEEARAQAMAPTQVELAPRGGLVGGVQTGAGPAGEAAQFLDNYFASSPEAAAQYEQLHGRPWEPTGNPMNSTAPSTREGTMAGSVRAGLQPQTGGLDALNKLVFASPEESAMRSLHGPVPGEMRVGEGRIGVSGRTWNEGVIRNAPTVVEATPAAQLNAAADKAAAREAAKAQGAKTQVSGAPTGMEYPTMVEGQPAGARVGAAQDAQDAAVQSWLNSPRVRPWDQAEARVRSAMQDLYDSARGRMDSAGGLNILKREGVRPSTDPVVQHGDQVWAMRRAARLSADEARGVATSLRDSLKDSIKDALSGGVGGAVVGKVFNHALGGMGLGMLGFSGRLAAASGRLALRVAEAVGKAMTSTNIRAIAVASSNRPWAYDESGPIKDPVERIQVIQQMAQNPQAVMNRIAAQAGDLAHVSPDMLNSLQTQAVGQLTRLAVRAPAIYFDRLGNPLMPPAGKMREFFEYENGVHDLGGLLDALASGSLTRPQAAALQESWGPVHVKVATYMLQDPEKLRNLPRAQLRLIEMVTGLSLTGAQDPMFLARQAQAWAPVDAPDSTAAPKPQSFNINPDGAPLPSQTSSGRAPGN